MGFDILSFISALIPIVPFSILLIKIKRLSSLMFIAFFVLVTLPLLSDWGCYFSFHFFDFNNCNPIFHIHSILMGLLISHLFFLQFKNKFFFIFASCVLLIFLSSAVYEFCFNNGYLQNNLFTNNLLGVIGIVYSVIYFYLLLMKLEVENVFRQPFFWIFSAILIYYGTTLSITLFENIVRSEDDEFLTNIWSIQLVVTIIYNLILAIGFWNLKKTK